MKGYAYGVLHISPSQIDDYSIADLWLAYVGYMRHENLRRRVDWEIARFAMSPHIQKKDRDKIRFPWEHEIKQTVLTSRAIAEFKKRRPHWFNKNG